MPERVGDHGDRLGAVANHFLHPLPQGQTGGQFADVTHVHIPRKTNRELITGRVECAPGNLRVTYVDQT